ncbi:hypothetical protein HYPSUDRAFT_198880 [Hypholoma sublateritium FD-334 SS-4]|uniref:Uncharacterized protein n=1 Tax=Hypholoma sublateritium (strain FD-334 SS-4) TaxID=945553 RepID=A0A0D2Q4W3_HYPSF|nr:hypothetical protein HYPSUDRAFT_198880 [Hypholoma sublateritium FD-334 SS-4]
MAKGHIFPGQIPTDKRLSGPNGKAQWKRKAADETGEPEASKRLRLELLARSMGDIIAAESAEEPKTYLDIHQERIGDFVYLSARDNERQ